jgi:hypothetical protein
MSAQEIAAAFTAHYYQCFDTNPDALVGLFVRETFVWSLSMVQFLPLLSQNKQFSQRS